MLILNHCNLHLPCFNWHIPYGDWNGFQLPHFGIFNNHLFLCHQSFNHHLFYHHRFFHHQRFGSQHFWLSQNFPSPKFWSPHIFFNRQFFYYHTMICNQTMVTNNKRYKGFHPMIFWANFFFNPKGMGENNLKKFVSKMELESIFQYFYYIITLEKISILKTWKFWGHEMMECMLFTYAFNMCI